MSFPSELSCTTSAPSCVCGTMERQIYRVSALAPGLQEHELSLLSEMEHIYFKPIVVSQDTARVTLSSV